MEDIASDGIRVGFSHSDQKMRTELFDWLNEEVETGVSEDLVEDLCNGSVFTIRVRLRQILCQLLNKIEPDLVRRFYQTPTRDGQVNGNLLALGQGSFLLGVPFDLILTLHDFSHNNLHAVYKYLAVLNYIGSVCHKWSAISLIESHDPVMSTFTGFSFDLSVPTIQEIEKVIPKLTESQFSLKYSLRHMYPEWILTPSLIRSARMRLRIISQNNPSLSVLLSRSVASSGAATPILSVSRDGTNSEAFSLSMQTKLDSQIRQLEELTASMAGLLHSEERSVIAQTMESVEEEEKSKPGVVSSENAKAAYGETDGDGEEGAIPDDAAEGAEEEEEETVQEHRVDSLAPSDVTGLEQQLDDAEGEEEKQDDAEGDEEEKQEEGEGEGEEETVQETAQESVPKVEEEEESGSTPNAPVVICESSPSSSPVPLVDATVCDFILTAVVVALLVDDAEAGAANFSSGTVQPPVRAYAGDTSPRLPNGSEPELANVPKPHQITVDAGVPSIGTNGPQVDASAGANAPKSGGEVIEEAAVGDEPNQKGCCTIA